MLSYNINQRLCLTGSHFSLDFCPLPMTHTAAILPVVLAVGSSIRGMPMDVLALPCIYSLGLMGVISPYATGPAPNVVRLGLHRQRRFLEVRTDLRCDLLCGVADHSRCRGWN